MTASNDTNESLNIDGRIVNKQQHIADTFNSYFPSMADNITIVNNNNPQTENKYSPNTDNKNSLLQYVTNSCQLTQKLREKQQLLKLKKNNQFA